MSIIFNKSAPKFSMPTRSTLHLGQLRPGQTAIISKIQAEAGLRQRLLALGFRPNRPVQMVRWGWFNGPLHVRVGTTEVMLRRQEALEIHLIDATIAGGTH